MTEQEALTAFSALSSETRLRIVKALVKAGSDGMSAGEIAKTVDASPSRASFHLTALSQADLAIQERKSRELIYRIDFKTIGSLTRFILKDCCDWHDTVVTCCSPKSDCC